jgi:hypothetical protein
MKSLLDERLGIQTPQILHLPPDVASLDAASDAIELADAYGLCDGHPLDESQRITLRAAMGERADGSWAALHVGDFKGRQGGGKSDTIAAREFYGLIAGREPLIIHTAHEFPTANESFLRLVDVFTNWDDLRSKVQRVLYGNGTQSINLKSGQRILYKARTGGAGRGFTKAALVVYDEAQHVQAEHVAASGPTRLAFPNSQSWYAGSGGFETSRMAWRLRRRALSGSGGRLAYVEGTAEQVSLVNDRIVSVRPDPEDRDGWAMANPGLGRWVTEESLAALFDELGPDLFARECMCVWEPDIDEQPEGLVPSWPDLVDADSSIVSHHSIALDVSPDRQWAAFAGAGRRKDGRLHVEAWERRPRTDWVLDVGKSSWDLLHIPLRIQSGSPAGSFIAPFRELGVGVVEVTALEHAQALGQFLDACTNDALRHRSMTSLNAAVKGAVVRTSGDTDVLARRTSKVDISPLVAVVIAVGGVPALDRRPRVHSLSKEEVAE